MVAGHARGYCLGRARPRGRDELCVQAPLRRRRARDAWGAGVLLLDVLSLEVLRVPRHGDHCAAQQASHGPALLAPRRHRPHVSELDSGQLDHSLVWRMREHPCPCVHVLLLFRQGCRAVVRPVVAPLHYTGPDSAVLLRLCAHLDLLLLLRALGAPAGAALGLAASGP
eukprot:Amastigsp_a843901_53.p3 type:complete len:169 gc:universal Amastigsp_a843901_53:741-235(-)